MTPSEFKAWFDGFTEEMKGQPTKAQWARIKERVAQIDGKTVTEYRYYHDYFPRYWAVYNPTTPTYTTTGIGTAGTNAVYCSNSAMYTLGQAEAVETGVKS